MHERYVNWHYVCIGGMSKAGFLTLLKGPTGGVSFMGTTGSVSIMKAGGGASSLVKPEGTPSSPSLPALAPATHVPKLPLHTPGLRHIPKAAVQSAVS
jgi:hypothetical protein